MPKVKKVLWGIVAALTTPEAIRHEKSLVVIVLTRASILVPAAAWVIDLAIQALK